MKSVLLFAIIGVALSSCLHFGEKTKDVALKASADVGEAVGKTSSEFVKGVKEGIDETFGCKVVLSENLVNGGLSTGKYFITNDSSTATKNKVSVYLIFSKDFTGTITAKVTDEANMEYGRKPVQVKAKQGDAFFVDYIFDKRTDIESRSTITLR